MKNEKLEQILKTSASLYFKFGIKTVTMDDIAAKCNISKKTLYKFVSDKTDLVKKTLYHVFSEKGRRMQEIINKNYNAIEEMYEIQKIIIEIISNHNPIVEHDLQKHYSEILTESKDSQAKYIYKMIMKNLEKGQKENIYRNDIDKTIISKVRVLISLCRIDCKIVSYKDFMNIDALNEMFKYHLYAVCNEKGFELIKKYNENTNFDK